MRIIGGEFRGRKIKQPEFETVRPTKDRIREAVFNMIAGKTNGSLVLDLFAGSGAYGLEALSRGAARAVFVEKDKRCSRIIEENLRTLGIEEEEKDIIIIKDTFDFIENIEKTRKGFDLIFSDPPYNKGMAKKILIKVNQYDILNPSGLLIIEHHAAESLPEEEGNVSILKQKTYGDISVSVYSR